MLIKQVLNLVVNARDTQLEILLNSLSVAEIKRLCADSILITPQDEDIRIVCKLPSHNLNQTIQTAVKKILGIVSESSNYDEFLKNLQEQILQYYTEPDKAKPWLLKD